VQDETFESTTAFISRLLKLKEMNPILKALLKFLSEFLAFLVLNPDYRRVEQES